MTVRTHLRPAALALYAAVLGGCGLLAGETDETPVLARVGDRELRASAVGELVPAGTAPEDSIALLRNYVTRWAREASVSNEAAEAVGEDPRIERLVDAYRVGLQRQRFEEDILRGAVDTSFAREEYESLYSALDQSAEAPHQLVRAIALAVPEDHPRLPDVERVWGSGAGGAVGAELRALGEEVATVALLETGRWYEAPELRLVLPVSDEDIPLGSRVVAEDGHRYFVRVFESVRRGARAPLAYLEPRLRKLLLEQRRAAYLESYINDVYREAQARDEVSIYVGNAQ